jgi:hypothetical protein
MDMSKTTMIFTPKKLTLWVGLSLGLVLPLTAMRRAPQLGQKPRRLQLKATRCS